MQSPYKWQTEAESFPHNQLGAFAEVGTGKTRASIMYLQKKWQSPERCLILTPSVALFNWKEEIKTFWQGEVPRIKILPTPSKRQYSEFYDNEIVIVNHEALDRDTFFLDLVKWSPTIVVCDELHRIKNHMSKRAKRVVTLGDMARVRVGLTGTLITNKELDVFYQYRFLDKGEAFGKYLKVFRAQFCIEVPKRYGMQTFSEWKFRPEKADEFHERLTKYAMIVKKEDVMELPPLIEEYVYFEMKGDQLKAYETMKRDYLLFLQGVESAVTANNAMAKALRLMQIASGYVTTETGEVVRFKSNPKLEYLEEMLPEWCKESKVIIWCSFVENYRMLEELCMKLGLGYRLLTGEMDAREKDQSQRDFSSLEEVRVMVANRKAGGIAINLIASNLSFVYSRNFNYEEEVQSEGRNYRGGSQIHEKIVKITGIIKGSVEEGVGKNLHDKAALSKMLLDRSGAFI